MNTIEKQERINGIGMRCKYNDCVLCSPYKHSCNFCGWNPEVSKARVERYRKMIAAKCALDAVECYCRCSVYGKTLDPAPFEDDNNCSRTDTNIEKGGDAQWLNQQ